MQIFIKNFYHNLSDDCNQIGFKMGPSKKIRSLFNLDFTVIILNAPFFCSEKGYKLLSLCVLLYNKFFYSIFKKLRKKCINKALQIEN